LGIAFAFTGGFHPIYGHALRLSSFQFSAFFQNSTPKLNLTTQNKPTFKASTASRVDAKWRVFTYSTDESAVFDSFSCGGCGVMPQVTVGKKEQKKVFLCGGCVCRGEEVCGV
jgi:hypothetical protein